MTPASRRWRGAAHVYVATTSFAALLESAFHNAAPPVPTLPRAVLAQWVEAEVSLRHDVRLVDLRDPQLAWLGVDRGRLVATRAAHYPCTRRWASQLRGRTIGGRTTHGVVWHSRQAELHARAMGGWGVTPTGAARPARLPRGRRRGAVGTPAPATLLQATAGGLGRLDHEPGRGYVADLTALLEIVTM